MLQKINKIIVYMSEFDKNVIHFIKLHKNIIELQETIQSLKEKKDDYQNDIINHIELNNLENNEFNIPKLKTHMKYCKSNSYESYSVRYLKEQFSTYFKSEEASNKLMDYLKQNRKCEIKRSIKIKYD